nr:hypothetical protein [uncultured Blautia sp.]
MSKLIDIPEGTDIIEVKKKMSRMLSTARNESKPTTCIMSGKPKTSFCNSHSVPQLALKNIADNGKLLLASSLIGIEVVDCEKGVNNSGTFHFICNDCDSSFFQDYENENNLQERPTDKMLAEIAVKNILLVRCVQDITLAILELLWSRILWMKFQKKFMTLEPMYVLILTK